MGQGQGLLGFRGFGVYEHCCGSSSAPSMPPVGSNRCESQHNTENRDLPTATVTVQNDNSEDVKVEVLGTRAPIQGGAAQQNVELTPILDISSNDRSQHPPADVASNTIIYKQPARDCEPAQESRGSISLYSTGSVSEAQPPTCQKQGGEVGDIEAERRTAGEAPDDSETSVLRRTPTHGNEYPSLDGFSDKQLMQIRRWYRKMQGRTRRKLGASTRTEGVEEVSVILPGSVATGSRQNHEEAPNIDVNSTARPFLQRSLTNGVDPPVEGDDADFGISADQLKAIIDAYSCAVMRRNLDDMSDTDECEAADDADFGIAEEQFEAMIAAYRSNASQ